MSPELQPVPGKKRRVLVVDDHPIVRQGLEMLLAAEPDMEVCGGAEGIAQALAEVEPLRPDLVVVDLSLKDGNGLEVIAQLCARSPAPKMLVVVRRAALRPARVARRGHGVYQQVGVAGSGGGRDPAGALRRGLPQPPL